MVFIFANESLLVEADENWAEFWAYGRGHSQHKLDKLVLNVLVYLVRSFLIAVSLCLIHQLAHLLKLGAEFIYLAPNNCDGL